MSTKEVERYRLLEDYSQKRLSLHQVAKFMKVSYRQAKRIWREYLLRGKEGLISKKRGGPGNRKISKEKKDLIITHIRSDYYDFGPTLIAEKLKELQEIEVSKETVRKWMVEEGIWRSSPSRKKHHQRRERRSCEGELVQMDGSKHHWFGKDFPKSTIHLAIDDATGKIMTGWFEKEECLEGYFKALYEYFIKRGLPQELYTDRHAIFKSPVDKQQNTQLGRSLKELGVGIIYAYSPQAKGRVERANRTLQDRLIKELRLQGIKSPKEANKFLPTFIKSYNDKFGKPAANSFNAHHPLEQGTDLMKILCWKEQRVVSKNLELNYNNTIYQLNEIEAKGLEKKKVSIVTTLDGKIFIMSKGKTLKFKIYNEIEYLEVKPSEEDLLKKWKGSREGHPQSKDHPYKKFRSKESRSAA